MKEHKQFLYLVISLLSLILFAIIATSFGLDILKSLDEIISIGLLGFLLLTLITLVETIAKIFRFRYALSREYNVKQLAPSYLVSIFLSFLVPSRFAGEATRPLAFRSNPKIPAGECLSAVSIERIFDVIFLPFFLFGAISSLFNPFIPALLVFGLALFLVLATTEVFILIASRIPQKTLSSFLADYFTSLRAILRDRKRFALISLFTLLTWLCAFLRLWLILQLVASPLSFLEVTSASAAAYLFSVLSVLPGGGVFFEGGGVIALTFFGVPPENALSAILLERFFAYWIFILAGLAIAPHIGKE